MISFNIEKAKTDNAINIFALSLSVGMLLFLIVHYQKKILEKEISNN